MKICIVGLQGDLHELMGAYVDTSEQYSLINSLNTQFFNPCVDTELDPQERHLKYMFRILHIAPKVT